MLLSSDSEQEDIFQGDDAKDIPDDRETLRLVCKFFNVRKLDYLNHLFIGGIFPY